MALKFYTSVEKRVKTKSHKVLGDKSEVCRSYKGKTGRGVLFELYKGPRGLQEE